MPLAGNYNPATAQSEANLPPREDSVVQEGDLCGFYVLAFMEAGSNLQRPNPTKPGFGNLYGKSENPTLTALPYGQSWFERLNPMENPTL